MGENIMFPGMFAAPRTRVLAASFIIGAAGAISSNTHAGLAGFSIVKTAATTGRYTCTLHRNYKQLLARFGSFTGPDSAAFPTTTGSQLYFRDNDIGQGAQDGTIEVQLVRTDTQADAEAANPSEVSVTFLVCDQTAP